MWPRGAGCSWALGTGVTSGCVRPTQISPDAAMLTTLSDLAAACALAIRVAQTYVDLGHLDDLRSTDRPIHNRSHDVASQFADGVAPRAGAGTLGVSRAGRPV